MIEKQPGVEVIDEVDTEFQPPLGHDLERTRAADFLVLLAAAGAQAHDFTLKCAHVGPATEISDDQIPGEFLKFFLEGRSQGRIAVEIYPASQLGSFRDLIEQVLLTAPGERVMRPTFGSGLLALVFEPNSTALAATTQALVHGALQENLAHLIAVQGVEIVNDDGALRVDVRYTMLLDQKAHTASFVAPGSAP